MTAESKVAVAVPVHNGALHLKQCLDCLANQDTPHMRVLIFENASTDGSAEIAKDYCNQDARFSFHPSDELLGMWSNFSRAIQLASQSGDFFLIRAHDDLSSTDFVSTLRKRLIDNPNAALVVPRVERIFETGVRQFTFRPELLDIAEMSLPPKFRKKIELPASWFYGMYRSKSAASIFLSSLREFPYPWGGDRYIVMQFLLRGLLVHEDGAIFRCRMGSDNESKYLRPEIVHNLKIRAKYAGGLARAISENNNLSAKQRIVLLSRIFASAPRHTYTSTRQILRRRFHRA